MMIKQSVGTLGQLKGSRGSRVIPFHTFRSTSATRAIFSFHVPPVFCGGVVKEEDEDEDEDEDKDKHEEAELEEKNEKEKLISFAVTKIKDFL